MQVQCEHVPRHLCVLQHLLREAHRTQPTTETHMGRRNRACTASTDVGNTHLTLRLPVRFQDLVPFHTYPIHILPIYIYANSCIAYCIMSSIHFGCWVAAAAFRMMQTHSWKLTLTKLVTAYSHMRGSGASHKATVQWNEYCAPHQRRCLYLGN